MFYLWVGVMTGVLLSYLWGRAHVPRKRPPWRSLRWWLAGIAFLLLFIPILWDAWRFGSGSLGPIEAVKGVLLPWAAGIGFGIWMYLIIGPLRRPDSTDAPAEQGSAAPLSFVPIIVALVFVTLIVSEDRYGWLSRLQKISFGGGGVEFAPGGPGAQRGPTRLDESRLAGGGTLGPGEVVAFVNFMSSLEDFIKRDMAYPNEALYDRPPPEADQAFQAFQGDLEFAQKVAVPLGKLLRDVQEVRRYDSSEFFVSRDFIDRFRAFIQARSGKSGSAPSDDGVRQDIAKGFKSMWEQACKMKFKYPLQSSAKDESQGVVPDYKEMCRFTYHSGENGTEQTAYGEEIEKWFKSKERESIWHERLPYGTLISSMLLYASGESIAAVYDLDQWYTKFMAKSPWGSADERLVFGAYRAVFQSGVLASQSRQSRSDTYRAITQSRKAVLLGDRLLSAHKWREQRKILDAKDGVAQIFSSSVCENELTSLFKIFFNANITISNNMVYYLSQEPIFAKKQGLVEEMEQRAKYISELNVSCLKSRDSAEQDREAKRLGAVFLDTAAAVELAMALEDERSSEKRARFCRALKHAEKAERLYREAEIDRRDDPSRGEDLPDAIQRWVFYRERVASIKTQVTASDCPT